MGWAPVVFLFAFLGHPALIRLWSVNAWSKRGPFW